MGNYINITNCNRNLQISSISTGFIEVPDHISINIYVQGCKNNCKNCQNPELQSFEGGKIINGSDIASILLSKPMADWICWLGGDAIYQPDAFLHFNKLFKSFNKRICLYTGSYFNDIKNLLDNVDIVIDGPWIEKLGSIDTETTNQKVYFKINKDEWRNIKFRQISQYIKEFYGLISETVI